jgi:tRNA modification GTPase
MLRLDPSDTIAAIASPSGPGLRGIVRLSGPRAWEFGLAGFVADIGEIPRKSRRARLYPGRLAVEGLRPTIPASIALWPAPRTYTGQPLAEIHTVGSPPVLQRLLADRLAAGARLAEPGEFTLRAFLSGRIDLTRAEAVLGVIDANNPAQLELALHQLAGGLATPIAALRDQILDTVAHLEAGLDFVEEADVDPLARSELSDELARASGELLKLADQLESRDRPSGMPRVVLVGPPNAGKSRLFNALLGSGRAIVSPVAGTTRDYLSATCECDGVCVELFDTAGVEDARDSLMQQAQDFRIGLTDTADLVLECGSLETRVVDSTILSGPMLRVGTKADLGRPEGASILTSAATGEGISTLRSAISATLRKRDFDSGALASTSARCHESLVQAGRLIRSASETLLSGGGDELVTIDLRLAVDELGKVVGATVSDEILDRIFRRFCIGK